MRQSEERRNHVHILLALPPSFRYPSHAGSKGDSSKWMNENGHRFAWQEGYAAFSVSASNLAQVAAEVRNQLEHHRHRTFEEEYLALLKKHGIDAELTRWAHTNVALTGCACERGSGVFLVTRAQRQVPAAHVCVQAVLSRAFLLK